MNRYQAKIAKATLMFVNKKSWDLVNHDAIIKKTKIKKIDLEGLINKKVDLLININHFFDFQLNNMSNEIEQTTKKDMIFEVMMMRFDILQIYRKPILKIFDSFKQRPKQLIYLIPSFIESMVLMASIAKIPINGVKGNLIIKGLLVVYFASFLIWIKDNESSLEKTMTSVDIYLDRANNFLNIFTEYNA